MQIDLGGRVAIVTGAAHGIGRAICRLLGQAGATVWAVDILREELDATVAHVSEAGGDCRPAVVDVTDGAAVQAYTGFVYEGPGMAGRAARQMAALLERRGVGGLDELRGQEAPR